MTPFWPDLHCSNMQSAASRARSRGLGCYHRSTPSFDSTLRSTVNCTAALSSRPVPRHVARRRCHSFQIAAESALPKRVQQTKACVATEEENEPLFANTSRSDGPSSLFLLPHPRPPSMIVGTLVAASLPLFALAAPQYGYGAAPAEATSTAVVGSPSSSIVAGGVYGGGYGDSGASTAPAVTLSVPTTSVAAEPTSSQGAGTTHTVVVG